MNNCPLQNPECVSHTLEVHNGCSLNGKNRCQDWLHNRKCWTKEDIELLHKTLDNYEKLHTRT